MTDLPRCPRCGRPFACGIAGAAPCPCTGITVSAATLERLRREHVGCLCLDCLRAAAARAPARGDAPAHERRPAGLAAGRP
jgi:hypothetical protein